MKAVHIDCFRKEPCERQSENDALVIGVQAVGSDGVLYECSFNADMDLKTNLKVIEAQLNKLLNKCNERPWPEHITLARSGNASV